MRGTDSYSQTSLMQWQRYHVRDNVGQFIFGKQLRYTQVNTDSCFSQGQSFELQACKPSFAYLGFVDRKSNAKFSSQSRSASKFHESPRRSLPNPLIEFDYIGTLRGSPDLKRILSNENPKCNRCSENSGNWVVI